ncbi:hypothetical protein B0T26DRAFT_384591 [Lasiosphaeria miniovina]|uniref:Uncharacterized protein n=1 Tax=Lasiosphaeria miniovina TaxID=1954250 RepID=A0AA40DUW9_9PEZI|nr:uncharacterized protein B0T26DRAFT_384591 [Lasiosphaeria miniovina]KAK0714081.1 hypothetical protein B0T26DRAFT_384591 [Lasiosphaeria miniovina]
MSSHADPQPLSGDSLLGIGITAALLLFIILPIFDSKTGIELQERNISCNSTAILQSAQRAAATISNACALLWNLLHQITMLTASLVTSVCHIAVLGTRYYSNMLETDHNDPSETTQASTKDSILGSSGGAISHVLCVVVATGLAPPLRGCETRLFITLRRQLLEFYGPRPSLAAPVAREAKPVADAQSGRGDNALAVAAPEPSEQTSNEMTETATPSVNKLTRTRGTSRNMRAGGRTDDTRMATISARKSSLGVAASPTAMCGGRVILPDPKRRPAAPGRGRRRSNRIKLPGFDLDSRIYESFPPLEQEQEQEEDVQEV